MAMENEIARAVETLRKGGLVAFPTETVYGLGGDATNADAVRKIFRVKQRPRTNPLIVHVAGEEVARRYVENWPEGARRLAGRFWPGPLTIIVAKGPRIVSEVTAGLRGVGLRMPDHPVALGLLRAFDGAVAAPSANLWTRLSPTTADHVRQDLGKDVDVVLDGGPCRVGIESTVISLDGEKPMIFRPGAVSREDIESVIGFVEVFGGTVETDQANASPGLNSQHYAPMAPTWRVERGETGAAINWCREHPDHPASLLLLKNEPAVRAPHRVIVMPDDPSEYARRLYAVLHDAEKSAAIWIEMPPETTKWEAVRDRLRRAARPG